MTTGSARSTFRLFGVNIESDIRPPVAPPTNGPIELRILHEPDLRLKGPAVLSVHVVNPDGGGHCQVYRTDDATGLRLEPVAEYMCSAQRIAYRLLDPLPEESLLWQLFGFVFAIWLEQSGHPVLHASAIEADGCAFGLLAHAGVGKTSLTLAFLARGHRVLGDDHLVMESGAPSVCVRPALPWLKVAPATARRFGLDYAMMPVLHRANPKRRLDLEPASRCEASVALRRLYWLDRDPTASHVSLFRMSGVESTRALMRHSYAPRTMAATGLAPRRLPLLAAALTQAGLRRLCYPSGLSRLDEVVEAVHRDLRFET